MPILSRTATLSATMTATQRLALAKLVYQRALGEAGRIGGAAAWRRLLAAHRNLRRTAAEAGRKQRPGSSATPPDAE